MQMIRLPNTSLDSGIIYAPHNLEFPAFYRETLEDEVRIAIFEMAQKILKTKLLKNPPQKIKYTAKIVYSSLLKALSERPGVYEYIAFLKNFFQIENDILALNNFNEVAVKEISDFVQRHISFIPTESFRKAVDDSLEGVVPGSTVYFYIPQYKYNLSDFNSGASTNSNEYMLKLAIVEARKRGIKIKIVSDNNINIVPQNAEVRLIDDVTYSGTQISKAVHYLLTKTHIRGKVKIFLGGGNLGLLRESIGTELLNREKITISCQCVFPDPEFKVDENYLTDNVKEFFSRKLQIPGDNYQSFLKALTKYVSTKFVRTLYKNPDNLSIDYQVHNSFFSPRNQDEFTDSRNDYYPEGLIQEEDSLYKTRSYPSVAGY